MFVILFEFLGYNKRQKRNIKFILQKDRILKVKCSSGKLRHDL